MKTLRPRLLRPTILGLSLGSLLLTTPVRADDQDTATRTEQPGFFQRLGHALFPPPRPRYYYVRRRPLSYVDENGRVIPVDRPGTVVSSTAALGPNSTVVHAGDSTITLTNRAPGAPYDADPALAAPDYAGAPSAGHGPIANNPDYVGPGPRPSLKPSDDGPKPTAKGDKAKGAEPDTSNVPFATPSKKRGYVKSPYAPYSELDATGLTSGSLAKDPTTGKIFKIP
jgi:hypothetical protein